ncbi:carbohydrate ABC transporter permease [Vallitalea okinawensis]|uniref:carbohydrate ABC transporter permease n=1 Tax=Vallitalea okinawensis TaxID=2078660 RepID=UPI000CFC4EB9|nr:carbohydrate ABC transporter permease [Vallitalea okinawensis]
MREYKTKSRTIFNIINIIIMILLVSTMILPLVNTFALAFSTDYNSMEPGIILFPNPISISGFITLFSEIKILRPFINNVFVTVVGVSLHISICSLTAYVVARHQFPGKKIFMVFVMITLMVPLQNIMIPMYLLYKELNLINTLWAIILTNMVNAYTILLLKNFFEGVPPSLGEAAYIEGANEMQMLMKIYLPLAKAGLATMILFDFVNRWNHYMEALLFIQDPDKYTLQLALMGLVIDSDGASPVSFITNNVQMAGVVFSIMPLLILYPFLQKYFISGIMLGSTKG